MEDLQCYSREVRSWWDEVQFKERKSRFYERVEKLLQHQQG
jgi:hypothetical protein